MTYCKLIEIINDQVMNFTKKGKHSFIHPTNSNINNSNHNSL